MVEVNVLELKKELMNLNKIVEEYEKNNLNLFNEIKNISFYWNDKTAINFIEQMKSEEYESKSIIKDLLSKENLLSYIYEEYIDIGKKIKYNVSDSKKTIKLIDEYIEILNDIALSFSTLNIVKENKNAYEVEEITEKLNAIKNTLVNTKGQIVRLSKKIERIEDIVMNKINNLEKIVISEFNCDI